ncbi:MAG TPA: hypothetical protein PKE29_06380 [Phycisphaerales bacterium]|nr:hypothetical protein [Phycisphaerales bacterium]
MNGVLGVIMCVTSAGLSVLVAYDIAAQARTVGYVGVPDAVKYVEVWSGRTSGGLRAHCTYEARGSRYSSGNIVAGVGFLEFLPGQGSREAVPAALNADPLVYVDPTDPNRIVQARGIQSWMLWGVAFPPGLMLLSLGVALTEFGAPKGRTRRLGGAALMCGGLLLSVLLVTGVLTALAGSAPGWVEVIAPWPLGVCALAWGWRTWFGERWMRW